LIAGRFAFGCSGFVIIRTPYSGFQMYEGC